jgi:hypothetical protein
MKVGKKKREKKRKESFDILGYLLELIIRKSGDLKSFFFFKIWQIWGFIYLFIFFP